MIWTSRGSLQTIARHGKIGRRGSGTGIATTARVGVSNQRGPALTAVRATAAA